MAYLLDKNNYTPRNEVGGGVYWIQRVRLSVVRVFCFPDIFWIKYADIEMKLGMIVYNDELQIKFEFRCY